MLSPVEAPVAYGQRRRWPKRNDEQDCTDFARIVCNTNSTIRNRKLAKASRNLYFHMGRQHIERDISLAVDEVRGYAFRDQANQYRRLRPTTNLIRPSNNNTIARLTRKDYVIHVNPDSVDPKIVRASGLGEKVLKSHWKKIGWKATKAEVIRNAVITGTAGFSSYYDYSLMHSSLVAVDTATKCPNPGCASVSAEPAVPIESLERAEALRHMELLREVPGDPESMEMRHCPTCPEPTEMQPYEPTPEEAEHKGDYFGRPLGAHVPTGRPWVDPMSCFQMFPENAGIGIIDPHTMRRFSRVRPVTIDYIEERWPEKCDELFPVAAEEIMRLHPTLGDAFFLGRYSAELDADIYDNHMLLYEITCEPYMEKVTEERLEEAAEAGEEIEGDLGDYIVNDGRCIYLAGSDQNMVLLQDAPLYITYQTPKGETKKMKRVQNSFIRFNVNCEDFWGDGLPEDGISPQKRINAIDAITLEILDRMGSPHIMHADDVQIVGVEWMRNWGAGRKLTYTRSGVRPEEKPEFVEGKNVPSSFFSVRDRVKVDFQDVQNFQRAEQGDNPKNVKNTSQLKLLTDNANVARGPVEEDIGTAIEIIGKHQLQMFYALRTPKDTYETDAKGAAAANIEYFRGADLLDQYNVEVTISAGVQGDIYQSEAAAEARGEGLYDTSNPLARREYLRMRGLPDVDEQQNKQIDAAEEVGVTFCEKLVIPAADPTIHDCWIWYRVLGEFIFDDRIKKLQDEIAIERAVGQPMPVADGSMQEPVEQLKWKDILQDTAEWEHKLAVLEAKYALAQQTYWDQGMQPEQAAVLYEQQLAEQQQTMLEQRAIMEEAKAKNLPITPMEPPPPPVEPLQLPEALEVRLYLLWLTMLQIEEPPDYDKATGEEMTPEQLLCKLLQFRALIEAYRLYAERKKQQAMAGVARIAAPGGSATPSGTEPIPGDATIPGPGQGQPGGGEPPAANQQGQQMPTGPLG